MSEWIKEQDLNIWPIRNSMGLPGGTMVKNLPTNAGDAKRCRFDPWVRKIPAIGNSNPLQYSCLENSMDKGAWQTTILEVTKELDTTIV